MLQMKKKAILQRTMSHLYLVALIMKQYVRGKHREEEGFTEWDIDPWKRVSRLYKDLNKFQHGKRCQKDVIHNWQKITTHMNKYVV